MTAEIIDQASELEELLRNNAYRLTALTTTQYQQHTALIAVMTFQNCAG